jgi:hypothetical protein
VANVENGARRAIPRALVALAFASACALLAWDATSHPLAAVAHDRLAALPLGVIAVALVVHQLFQHATRQEWAKTALAALAFALWAANQLCPDRTLSTLFNDIAIAAFVVDACLVIVGLHRASLANEPNGVRYPRPHADAALDDRST